MYVFFYVILLREINSLFCNLSVNIEDSGPRGNKRRAEAEVVAPPPAAVQVPVAVEPPKRMDNIKVGGKKENDKASDDFYFEKFRRQFRR